MSSKAGAFSKALREVENLIPEGVVSYTFTNKAVTGRSAETNALSIHDVLHHEKERVIMISRNI